MDLVPEGCINIKAQQAEREGESVQWMNETLFLIWYTYGCIRWRITQVKVSVSGLIHWLVLWLSYIELLFERLMGNYWHPKILIMMYSLWVYSQKEEVVCALGWWLLQCFGSVLMLLGFFCSLWCKDGNIMWLVCYWSKVHYRNCFVGDHAQQRDEVSWFN